MILFGAAYRNSLSIALIGATIWSAAISPITTQAQGIPGMGGGVGGVGGAGGAAGGAAGGTAALTAALSANTAALNNLAAAANNVAAQGPGVSAAVNNLADSASSLAGSVDKASTTIGNVSDQWIDQTDDFLQFGNEFLDLAGSYQSLISDLQKDWGPKVDEFNESFSLLAGGISALSDPKRMALVAAASGFAGTLASGIASALPELIWKGAEGIVEAITQKKADSMDYGMVRNLLGTGASDGVYRRIQNRVTELSRLVRSSVNFLKLSTDPEERTELRTPASTAKVAGELETQFATLQVQQDLLEARYQKAIQAQDLSCALETKLEANAIAEQIAGFHGVLEAVDTLSVRDTRSMSQNICESLKPLWGEIAKAEGELQLLRGKILESQRGFYREEIKRTQKESRKDYKAAREELIKTKKKRELGSTGGYVEPTSLTRLWDRFYAESIKDFKEASQMNPEDLQLKYEACLKEGLKTSPKGISREFAQACWLNTTRELFTGDYGKESTERFEQYQAFFTSMEGLISQQEQILTELRPENEIQQAMLLAYAEEFTQIALDQKDAESKAKELADIESQFETLCGRLGIEDWTYTRKFLATRPQP